MPTHATEDGLGGAVKRVADHAKAIVSLEAELAQLELKRKAAALGLSIGLLVVAGLLGLFALGFGIAAMAAAFATFLPWWAALLVTFGICLVLAGILVAAALPGLKKGAPPLPEQAMAEARKTKEAVRANGR